MKTFNEVLKEKIALEKIIQKVDERIKSGQPLKGDISLKKRLKNDISTLKWVLGVK